MENKEKSKEFKERRMASKQFRALENDEEELIIEGYAVVFNEPATYDWIGTEVISDKALDNTDMSDVVLRYNHNDSFIVLARTRNKSLELTKDNKGLFISAKLQKNISDHVNVYNAIKSELIDKQSFAFTVKAYEYDIDTDTRTITDIAKLFDVSVVDQPFYEGTDVSARNLTFDEEFLQKRKNLINRKKTDKIKIEILKKLG